MDNTIILITRSSLMRMFCYQFAGHGRKVTVSASQPVIFTKSKLNISYLCLVDYELIVEYGQKCLDSFYSTPCSIPFYVVTLWQHNLYAKSEYQIDENEIIFIPDIKLRNQYLFTKTPEYPVLSPIKESKSLILYDSEATVFEPELDVIIGHSRSIKKMKQEIHRFAQSDAPILLLGESGTGKSFIAKVIHNVSLNKKGPFCAVNVATIPESLAESELFGTDNGAFTGAVSRGGYFEQANNGTLFLDEAGELSSSIQAKLLRVLEDRIVHRVGSSINKNVNVRFICATNADIRRNVEKGTFRKDLWFRINTVIIEVPSLRSRLCDIPLLAQKTLSKYGKYLNDAATKKLQNYDWPGNVRELISVIQRACLLSKKDSIEACDISFEG